MEESRKILERFLERGTELAITEGGRTIGSIGLKTYNDEKLTEFADLRGTEIGFVLAKDRWGNGLMTEAVRAVIDRLFRSEGVDFLLCSHFDSNPRSRRVQEKCGFLPYRKLFLDTYSGGQESGVLNLRFADPAVAGRIVFSHPETLIYRGHTRTPEELWRAFCDRSGHRGEDCDAWAFGGAADRLAGLVLRGVKRATSSAYDCYLAEGEPLPTAGDYSVILNSSGYAVAVIRNVSVTLRRFCDVDEGYAAAEGEGDLSLDYWRQVHRDFFSEELGAIGKAFSEEMTVVCEEFECVFRYEDALRPATGN